MTKDKNKNYIIDKIHIGKKKYQKSSSHDVILGGILGLILGWPGIVAGLVLGILIAGLVSFLYLVGMALIRRYQAFTAIPYGPFLVASALLLLFFKDIFI